LGPNKSHYYESWSESADEIIYIDYDKEWSDRSRWHKEKVKRI
jgi:hypothetical protein